MDLRKMCATSGGILQENKRLQYQKVRAKRIRRNDGDHEENCISATSTFVDSHYCCLQTQDKETGNNIPCAPLITVTINKTSLPGGFLLAEGGFHPPQSHVSLGQF